MRARTTADLAGLLREADEVLRKVAVLIKACACD
jgi:hypothetical protein